ncbi:hypothetical protein GOB94_14030 [Granulicella sp. 5B5]|uniref:hypothetical protein n=1 Tax=Granulicella sp. 5B5 TaxID=1617967 RepID=UPI001758D035|nr:hypothetical protein [Granulicella sp. 5B5]QMV19684.1 hypothetical protein GOB94_14030 [Granulicella sp. 5B5]
MTKEMKKSLAQLLAMAVLAAGLVVFTRGVWLAWRPGGWMVAGLSIVLPALFWLYDDVRDSKGR